MRKLREERLKIFVDDSQIYAFYIGDFTLTHKYNSPLRDDPRPSFQIKRSKKGNLYWRDYGLEKQEGFDAIAFVMHLYGLSREKAVKKIWKDMILSKEPIPQITLGANVSRIPYNFYYGELRDWELEYWRNLGIGKKLLDLYNVKSLTALYRTDKVIWKSEKTNPAYIYLYEQIKDAFKAYRPLDPRGDKFRGQNNGGILEGYEQLPKNGKKLLITKSTKDILVLRRAGVISTSPTGS